MKAMTRLGAVGVLAGVVVLATSAWPGAGNGAEATQRESEHTARQAELLGGRGSTIGATVRDADEADLKREKWTGSGGVVIEEVRRESPAERAGLRAGDLVVEFDGERVRSARQFARLVQEAPAGRSVKGVVVRGGHKVGFEVTPEPSSGLAVVWLEDAKERLGRLRTELSRLGDIDVQVRLRPGRLGVSVLGLTPQLAAYFGVKDGVLVTSVDADSPAAKAGVKAGDVITAFNGARVAGPDDLRRHVAPLEAGAEFTLTVTRDRKELTLKGKLEDRDVRRRTLSRVPVD